MAGRLGRKERIRTGIKPKGTRPVAHTRLMGGARLDLLAFVILLAYLAFRARLGG